MSHALLSTGRYKDAVRLTSDAASYLDQHLGDATPELLSVYGTLLLGGSVAAACASDAGTARTFLTAADDAATRLGEDANHLWTAFGPTNVAIHRVAAAGELGDFQVAIDLGPSLDTASLPMERRVRHALEVSAHTARGTGRTTRWPSCSTLSGWPPSRFGITTSAASSSSRGYGSSAASPPRQWLVWHVASTCSNDPLDLRCSV
ncbi:hypothetical protein [Actinoplanes sp. NPDC049599]|uniref:hypothetical protein n=1 Tax=Actinoplanes sp. NPDC049599 TaxID=3363903 RepID=UPI0037B086CA